MQEAKALLKARKNGRIAGQKLGEKNKSIQIARKMLAEKIDIKTIIKLTDLTKEEIQKLQY